MEIDFSKQIAEAGKTGLWENIRKKKQRMGKNYRPAKPGSPDRPSKKAWEKAQAAIELTYTEAEKKTLNKPFRLPSGSKKKFGVYVKNPKGNVVMVKFGDPNMEIKRDDPDRRKNFRARHQCDSNPGPKWKARYWSCRMWEGGKSVTQVTKGSIAETSEASEEVFDLADLLNQNPNLSTAAEIETENEEMVDYQEEATEMAYQNLSTIKRKAEQLMAMIDANPETAMEITEPWVAAKITVIDDYIGAVHDYLASESTED
ncbi:MAG: hypothetical protein ACO3E4_06790 [Candidatus Nanopelagicaceae bacterium]